MPRSKKSEPVARKDEQPEEKRHELFTQFSETLQVIKQEVHPRQRMQANQDAMTGLYQQLRASHPSDVLAFGQDLFKAMLTHDSRDDLATAHQQNRAIFRSWHRAGAIDETKPEASAAAAHSTEESKMEEPRIEEPDRVKSVKFHIGFDALNVLLDPKEFRQHKEAYKAGAPNVFPTIEAPSTLLLGSEQQPSVFSTEHATVTALQPEEHYAAFFAFNTVAK